jgi:two-component system CheB/CheR fusion protein
MNERKKTTIKGIQVKMNGSEQMINLTVAPFDEPEAMRGLMMVVFEDVEMPSKGGRQARRKSKSVSNLETINNELILLAIEDVTTHKEQS